MYHDILLPTDGSALSRKAVEGGIQLAKRVGARVHGFYVVPQLPPDALDSLLHLEPELAQRQAALFSRMGESYLAAVGEMAKAAGVPCDCRKVVSSMPHAMILLEVARLGCDLIYMASHGWNGDHDRLLGSVTLRVLNTSPVPVLVHKTNVLIGPPFGASSS
ncbi:universal stress protein [Pseudoduganella eburnea]|uniref:Universal stress protein n=1 Tax=Massilia eburnea TaxID=1776165 RepID=A0A6L6QCX9_9BURK|nr:universal stress protein [Massilia eburnea]MTW10019.1 universal stress protein [Massilia eburnea]